MPTRVLTDCAAHVDAHDFTTDVNYVTLDMAADVKDRTTFGSGGWREKMAGLRLIDCQLRGFWQSGTDQVDPEVFGIFGTVFSGAARVHTFAPLEELPSDPATLTDEHRSLFFQAGQFAYKIFDQGIGEIYPFELGAQGKNGAGVVDGVLIRNRANVSATGKLGVTLDTATGIASGQSLYAAVHIFSVGTTITLQVQSDDNTGFGSPTTLATLGPFTTAQGVWLTPVAGPITDRYFRINVSAITGTFSVAASLGVK